MLGSRAWAAFVGAAFSLYAQDLVPIPQAPRPDTAAADSAKARAAAADTSGDSVSYAAERIRFRDDRFSLSDGAWLKYKGSTLTADSIVYFAHDDVVEALGAPLLEDKLNPPILGYRMRYNLKTKVGTVYYGSSKRNNQTLDGVEIRREPDGDIYIARGDFSTCDLPDKHYFFYARRMIVEPNDQILSGPIVMNIADVPVAVLPMMLVPLGKGRRSGLLQPKFGGDQTQGFYMSNLGYYWAINDYTDFLASGDIVEGQSGTFDNTDLNTVFRWNKRYVWNGSLSGKTYVSQFDPGTAGGVLDFTNDLNLTPDGRQTLIGSGRLQSDPTIVQRNALTTADALEQTANASLGYRRQFDWNQATLNVDLTQVDDLTQNNIDRSLPDVNFHVGGPLVPAPEDEPTGAVEPWYRKWSWDYASHFNVDQVQRPVLDLAPGDTSVYAGYSDQLAFSGKYAASYFNLTPSLNFSQLWSLDSRTGDSTQPFHAAWDPAHREIGDYFFAWNTGLTADTRLYGIAQAGDHPWFGRLAAVRHTLTPSVSLTYAPHLDTNTHFYGDPKIGGTPYQSEQKTLGFQLGNDVDLKLADPDSAKKKPSPYKLLSSSSQLAYNFADKTRPWSDLTSTFSLYLTRNVAFTVTADHTLYDDFAADSSQRNQLTSPILKSWGFGWRKGVELSGGFSDGLHVRDTRGQPTAEFEQTPWSASLNYSFDFSAQRVGSTGGSAPARFFGASEYYEVTRTHQASASLNLNPTAGWKMSYNTQFNFSEGRFSQHEFSFERDLHCWRMDFHWTPVGVAEGWNFSIYIVDLPDIKLQTSDTHLHPLVQ